MSTQETSCCFRFHVGLFRFKRRQVGLSNGIAAARVAVKEPTVTADERLLSPVCRPARCPHSSPPSMLFICGGSHVTHRRFIGFSHSSSGEQNAGVKEWAEN